MLFFCMQRAVKENREMREKQATLERKKQERDQSSKKRGSFKFFSRSSKSFEEDVKKEFEAKIKTKKIDIKALEESRKEKVRQSSEKQQKDFRHVLRHTDHSKAKKSAPKSAEKKSPTAKNETDTGHSSIGQQLRVEEKKKGRGISSSGATELTGSWDYIPSEPSSTVDLVANLQEGAEGGSHQQKNTAPPRDHVPSHRLMEAVEQYAHQPEYTRERQSPPTGIHEWQNGQYSLGYGIHGDQHSGVPPTEYDDREGYSSEQHGPTTQEYDFQGGYSGEQQGPPATDGEYYDHSRDSSDDITASSPILDLPSIVRISAGEEPQDWNRNVPNEYLDYETQF